MTGLTVKADVDYRAFFSRATGGREPYPYQIELACAPEVPELLDVPTGLGKTAAAVLGWLFRRRFHPDEEVRRATPRRLVYCLPMRTLVEQTEASAKGWLSKLELRDQIGVHVLMGGAETTDWDRFPERDAILIGTQDMLLSRALNRGYGMSRYRWPMHFALLNNDCLWVLDETQLMGVGLITSVQLQGLRRKLKFYGTARTLWMSATLNQSGLSTVDHPVPEGGFHAVSLGDDDRAEPAVRRLIDANKPCSRAAVVLSASKEKSYPADLAQAVVEAHAAGTLTLIVVNRVRRAQEVFQAIEKLLGKRSDSPERYLIHSRFRKVDRDAQQQAALDESTIPEAGRIVVATQAIEAGVDISATVLFTELAPWSSLVQRFGRCNRRGVCGTGERPSAHVYWIDVETDDAKKAGQLALPYVVDEFETARSHLSELSDVGSATLAHVQHEEPRRVVHTIRRKDLLELWDTTPDLAGNDLDVSRYIRDSEDTDVQVFWRDGWDESKRASPNDLELLTAPERDELCSVPFYAIGGKSGFLSAIRKNGLSAWQWNPLDKLWDAVAINAVRPGMVLLLHSKAGGYDASIGWTGDPKDQPVEPHAPEVGAELDAYEDDDLGGSPIPLAQHLRDVAAAAEALKKVLDGHPEGIDWNSVIRAAWWHDVGKAHPAFQMAMRDCDKVRQQDAEGTTLWAKSGMRGFPKYRMPDETQRRGFRHELASALAWLRSHKGEPATDLIAFLIAAHHGKVRGSIRSLPNEKQSHGPERRFARGIWDGDLLPAVDLGNGETCQPLTLSLDLMELGERNGTPSWLTRVLKLRDDEEFGPFRLAYLEMLVRIADWRGSAEGEHRHAE